MKYQQTYDEYWSAPEHLGKHSFGEPDSIVEEVLSTCGTGSIVDVGCGMGALVKAFLSRGISAQGVDVSPQAIDHCKQFASGSFAVGSVLDLPYATGQFDTVVSTDCLAHIEEQDIAQALREIGRVARRFAYLRLPIADGGSPNRWHRTVRDRAWWEMQCFRAGFRKHPAYYRLNNYEQLEHESGHIVVLLEKLPAAAFAEFSLESLAEERDLHMDMLRETGSRSDAHVVRYSLAAQYIRPGDTVLDAACGLGYGAHVMRNCSLLRNVIGIDDSDYAVRYGTVNFASEQDGVEFRRGRLPEALQSIPDHSIDFIASFETLEHVEDPQHLMREFRRVLKPSGRIIVSVPNDWADETGEDPNPYHFHVYTWERLIQEVREHFLVDAAYAQTANQLKQGSGPDRWWVPGQRVLRKVADDEMKAGVFPDCEWALLTAMRSPQDGNGVPYVETTYDTYPASPDWHATAFERDYLNPWLVKGMVTIGHRLENSDELTRLAEEVSRASPVQSADRGAALCVRGYQLLSSAALTAQDVASFAAECEGYLAAAPQNPHALRWHVSLRFLLGKLWQCAGDFDLARRWYLACIDSKFEMFSPVLATKLLDSCLNLGFIEQSRGNHQAASEVWQRGITIADRALHEDWRTAIGDLAKPNDFGLDELSAVVEKATSCGFALKYAEYAATRPAQWWWQHQRDRSSQLSKIRQKVLSLESIGPALQQAHAVLTDKDGVIQDQGQEIQRLGGVLDEKQGGLRVQANEIHRLNAVLNDKQAALLGQAGEIQRLHAIVDDKQRALHVQVDEIRQLDAALSDKQAALQVQAEEIHRLHAVLDDKQRALHVQAEDIHRLDAALSDKQAALHVQAEELHRLNAVVDDKQAALRVQAEEIDRLHAVLHDKQAALHVQTEEIHRLNAAFSDKQAALLVQAKDIERLNLVLSERQDALHGQAQEIQRLRADLADQMETVQEQARVIDGLNATLGEKNASIDMLGHTLQQMEKEFNNTKMKLGNSEAAIQALQRTKWFRLREAVIHQPWGLEKIARIAYLLAAMATPRFVRTRLAPVVAKARTRFLAPRPAAAPLSDENGAYVVQHPASKAANAPRVIHVIANFMTGGSSRLVVDLVEYLGSQYAHSVVTSYIPTPPAYTGIDITEFRFPENEQVFVEHFAKHRPDLIHVHYWGDCDEPWYAKAITAAETLNIPVIENINTPIAPYMSSAVRRYVYVSDYVRREFGQPDPSHVTVYPGSDFQHFNRKAREELPEDCVGMVYRLERDKLNEEAIIPFIRTAQKRPRTRILIVGGGSLLEPFKQAVEQAGVSGNFEFTGYVSYDKLPELYRRMTVFVAPVWKESFGQVSAFAMNMRVPVVGYDIGAIGEIVVDRKLLAEPANAEMLSDIVVHLLDSPDERKHMGDFHRRRAQDHFSVQAMIEAYRGMYHDVINEQVVA